MQKSVEHDESTHGIFTVNSSNRKTKVGLHALDVVASIFVVSPLVISYWRVTWSYIEHISIDLKLNIWLCFFCSVIMHTMIAMLRNYFYESFDDYKRKDDSNIAIYSRRIATKLYAYVFSIICIANWMSGWAILSVYNGSYISIFLK